MRLITIFILLSACGFSQSNSSDIKLECLSSDEEQVLNRMISDFESQLIQEYGETDYVRFLNDMKEFALPPEFFIDTDGMEFLQSIKEKEVFSEFYILRGDEYVINSAGAFNKCLKEINESPELVEIIETTELMAVSPGIIAGALTDTFSQNELKSTATRSYIVVNLYSLFALNIYDRFK